MNNATQQNDAGTLLASASLEDSRLELPFDQHQRYKVVADVLETLREDSQPLRVLDVGGGEGIVLRFLPHDDVKILDRTKVEGLPGFIEGDATALPFEDETFDYVTSVDVYEHVEPVSRRKYLSELRRVARKGVLLASPFDSVAVRGAEKLANEVHRAVHSQGNPWLNEHARNVLPDLAETRDFFEGHQDSVAVVPNGYLPHWLAMISLTFYGSRLEGEARKLAEHFNAFYNESMYRHDNAEPCYRHLIISLKETGEVNLDHLISSTRRPQATFDSSLFSAFSATLSFMPQLKSLEERLAQKDTQLAHKEVQVRDLSKRLAQHLHIAAQYNKMERQNTNLKDEQRRLRARLAELKEQNTRLKKQQERILESRLGRAVGMFSRQRQKMLSLFGIGRR